MHISDCLKPQRVFNKYLSEYVYARCGTCLACTKRKSSVWVQRLEQERYCWRYCVFATLTYDNEHLPLLHSDVHNRYFYDVSNEHSHPIFGNILIDREELYTGLGLVERSKLSNWIDGHKNGDVPYLSVGDAQRFIKRYRINVHRDVQRQIKLDKQNGKQTDLSEKDEKVRYFLCGEYGETLLRPHYHVLFFFSSEYQANRCGEILSKSWKFGRVDWSFVATCNASYVAGYVNSVSNLPKILLNKRIKPFALFSKHPFIGSLCHNSNEVKELFFGASPTQVILNHKKTVFENVPLWSSYQRRLYPKISGFSKFSHSDRVSLYRAYERFTKVTNELNFLLFLDYVKGRLHNVYTPSLYSQYVDILKRNETDEKKINARVYNWYCISSRVYAQACAFYIPIRMYVSIIERFYDNVEKLKLKNQYEYEENLAKNGKLVNAYALDLDFVRILFDSDLSLLSYEEIEAAKSFGIDLEKFYSDDPAVRASYRENLVPQNLSEWRDLSLDLEVWQKAHIKTKVKNDYVLSKHPDMVNVMWLPND